MSNSINLTALQDVFRSSNGDSGRAESVRRMEGKSALAPKPVDASGTVKAEAPMDEVNSAVSKINDFVKVVRRDLEFSVDEETGRTVITVRDSETDQVIRQIPPEEVLAVAENLEEVRGLLFKGRA